MRLHSLAACICATSCAAALLPVLDIATATDGTWTPALPGGAFYGDVRAVITLPASFSGPSATAQIFWRRRDPHPEIKKIFVVDKAGKQLPVINSTIEGTCGLVSFSASAPGDYYVYYLPFIQNSGGASVTFSWQGCNSTDPTEANPCVLGRRALGSSDMSADSVCTTVLPAASVVTRLENRNDFNAFTDMEMIAAPAEVAATADALQAAGSPFVAVFPVDRDHSVRVFDAGIPVRWTVSPAFSPPAFVGAAHPGENYYFQLGLWAYLPSGVSNLTANSSGLLGPGGSGPFPLQFVNLEGVAYTGDAFNKTVSLAPGMVGSLWVGFLVPPDAPQGPYTGTIVLSAPGAPTPVTVQVTMNVDAAAVPFGGANNITSLSRLAWLYSTRGLEDVVPEPFVPVGTSGGGASGQPLTVTSLLRTVTVSPGGLLENAVVSAPSMRRGLPVSPSYTLLSSPVQLLLYVNGSALPAVVTSPATTTDTVNSSTSWTAASTVSLPSGGTVTLSVTASYDFTSYFTFAVEVANTGSSAVSVDDIRLTYQVHPDTAKFVVGMGTEGSLLSSLGANVTWNWSNTTATNKLWLGRAEAGLSVNLNGDGAAWSSPMFGADYPVVPFVPNTWGGADALPQDNPNGASATPSGVFVATSGPRVLQPVSLSPPPLVYRFEIALTPSKQVNWQRHWHTRAIQVGYGTNYISPQDVAAQGATVVTLHQGCPGIVNGSLINPYISYPFLNDTVPLLTNYTAQSNDLGMTTKFYYTIRELSSHAVETFAFLALQGEIFLDQDPWIVVQPGYSHAWNAHGGSAYLHQHLVTHYAACWQQTLSNGEWDPAVCDIGVSRLFNYYVEGLWWSVTQPPYINGIYYDGTNFPRLGMQRIRRVADTAAAASPRGIYPLLDVHTGNDPSPPAVSYAGHYPLMDYVWNGEGFDFAGSPAYWLTEVSSRIHGMSGDTLGGGSYPFRAMLFGMTERNSGTAPALWRFWDDIRINETTSMGWWEDDVPVQLNVTCGGSTASGSMDSGATADGNCSVAWNVTTNGYYDGEPCGDPAGNLGCWPNPQTLAETEAACCANPACAGFSAVPASGGLITGCYKRSQSCFRPDAGASGYYKPGFVPPDSGVLATTFSAFGSRAVIVVASYCPAASSTVLTIDYAALGLDAAKVKMSAPAIAGVQAAQAFPDAAGPYPLQPNSGVILLLQ